MQSWGKQLGRFTACALRVFAEPPNSPSRRQQTRTDAWFQANLLGQCATNQSTRPSPAVRERTQPFNPHSLVDGLLQIAVSRAPRPDHSPASGTHLAGALTIQR
jgi:hypothetical protein